MIQDDLYKTYLNSLLNGDKSECLSIVKTLLDHEIKIQKLYTQLFQRSMYQVGELWELNKISVAREHLATAITESMLSATYPYLFSGKHAHKKAIITCTANEYHQLGGKMVADILELHGWDAHFLGANTPVKELVELIDEIKPDLIGLSLAIYFNLSSLKTALDHIKNSYGQIDLLVGGHAFIWGGTSILKKYSGINYFESLDQLEENLKRRL